MKTIDELWYGNIAPSEQCTRDDKRLKELLKLVARNREELDGTLTDKQKETLEKFEDCMAGCVRIRIQAWSAADGRILPTANNI